MGVAVCGIASAIATLFLAYSIARRKHLGISMAHPRVLVEATLALSCGVVTGALAIHA